MAKNVLITTRGSKREFIRSGKITHVYGPPKIGKSTLSAVLALELARLDKRSLIISTERPIEIRMSSMIYANENYHPELLEKISTATILRMDELIRTMIRDLPNYPLEVELLIIDSLTACYRFDPGSINLTLIRKALSSLQSLALREKVAFLFTNQVASMMNDSNDFRPVASASTRNYSDISLRLTRKRDGRTESVFEGLSGEEEEVLEPFTITDAGIEEFDQIFIIED